MVERTELSAYLDELLQPSEFSDYCPNGLQVEGRDRIKTLISGVTASQALIEAAQEQDADALLVHHGYFWRNEDARLTICRWTGMKARSPAGARHPGDRRTTAMASDINGGVGCSRLDGVPVPSASPPGRSGEISEQPCIRPANAECITLPAAITRPSVTACSWRNAWIWMSPVFWSPAPRRPEESAQRTAPAKNRNQRRNSRMMQLLEADFKHGRWVIPRLLMGLVLVKQAWCLASSWPQFMVETRKIRSRGWKCTVGWCTGAGQQFIEQAAVQWPGRFGGLGRLHQNLIEGEISPLLGHSQSKKLRIFLTSRPCIRPANAECITLPAAITRPSVTACRPSVGILENFCSSTSVLAQAQLFATNASISSS